MLSKVSLLCFAASYAVVLILEIARLFVRVPLRRMLVWGFTSAGLLAHSSYLVMRAQEGIAQRGLVLSNWYHWCLIAAWALAVAYLIMAVSRPQSSIGIFMLPLILALIGIADRFPKDQVFSTSKATQVWGMVHGCGLLLGTVTVLLGFATGCMYLLQAKRLKAKKLGESRIQLPSLEWLSRLNERALVASSFFLLLGVLSGVVLNLIQHRGTGRGIPWADPSICVSGLLLVWLIAVTIFSSIYRPARFGRKVAYLTIGSFVVLAITLGVVLFNPSGHAAPPSAQRTQPVELPHSGALNSGLSEQESPQ